jgi:hypothetical protein
VTILSIKNCYCPDFEPTDKVFNFKHPLMTKCSNLTQNLICVLIIKSLFRWNGQIYSTYPAILLHLTMHIKYYYYIPSTVSASHDSLYENAWLFTNLL